MIVKRECIKRLRSLIRKFRSHMKLKQLDDWWYLMGGSCFGLFPPSFYHTHTEEEIKRITDEELYKLRAIRDKLNTENNLISQEQ